MPNSKTLNGKYKDYGGGEAISDVYILATGINLGKYDKELNDEINNQTTGAYTSLMMSRIPGKKPISGPHGIDYTLKYEQHKKIEGVAYFTLDDHEKQLKNSTTKWASL